MTDRLNMKIATNQIKWAILKTSGKDLTDDESVLLNLNVQYTMINM